MVAVPAYPFADASGPELLKELYDVWSSLVDEG
jgi:hypothetical protein